MPIKIIRQDITRIECDAIVNPSNSSLSPDGGVDEAIHKAAGPELLEYCMGLGGCAVGEAKITPAFGLPCKYIIHTVGPEWKGGRSGEPILLRSCYKEAMTLAIKNKCRSIAFPLISSGLYGYPKDRVLREATEAVSELPESAEMEVYIVVYDKTAYSISKALYSDVQSFIDNFYEESRSSLFDDISAGSEWSRRDEACRRRRKSTLNELREPGERFNELSESEASFELDAVFASCNMGDPSGSLDLMLGNMDKGFADTLFYYIDKKGMTDVEAYKRSNVGKKTFSKIKCNRDYRPSKITAVSFAIGLHLNLEETGHLLRTAGLCLSRANKFDVIIEYFVTYGKYKTIFDVNEVLYQFDQSLLGV